MPTDAELAELRKLPLVIDRSWDRTTLKYFADSGCVGVMGYFSFDPSKNWTQPLLDECHAAGMWAGGNWEGTGDWAEFSTGAAGGRRAGQAAKNQADALGWPTDLAIIASADYDAQDWQYSKIFEWLDAFGAACGRPIGLYGDADLIDAALAGGHVVVTWQTNAYGWSSGRISDKAALVQFYGNGGLSAEVDENRLRDASKFAWYPHGHPSPPSKDDDMNRDETITLLRAPEFSQAKTRDQVAALDKRTAAVEQQLKAALLLLKAINDTVNAPKKG